MSAEDYYPAGSYNDPNAPWNQSEPDDREFDVYISQTLSKSTSVTTHDYSLEREYLDPEDGGYIETPNTENTNWTMAYDEEHYTPLELIAKFKEMLEDTIESAGDIKLISPANNKSLKYLIDECSNWVEDETVIEEE